MQTTYTRSAISALLVFFACVVTTQASVLEVTGIGLTGSGVFVGPDPAPYGGEGVGGQGVAFTASGSNDAGDWVTVAVRDIEVWPTPLTAPVFVPMAACVYRFVIPYPLCNVVVDGVTGYGNFTRLGGGAGSGLLQVFAITPGPGLEQGPLLAEAQVSAWVLPGVVTWRDPVRQAQGNGFSLAFDIAPVQPPTVTATVENPEPGAGLLVVGGLVYLSLRQRWGRRQIGKRVA